MSGQSSPLLTDIGLSLHSCRNIWKSPDSLSSVKQDFLQAESPSATEEESGHREQPRQMQRLLCEGFTAKTTTVMPPERNST